MAPPVVATVEDLWRNREVFRVNLIRMQQMNSEQICELFIFPF